MADITRRQVRLEVPWRTLLKLLAAIALGWALVQLGGVIGALIALPIAALYPC